ncbi:MAG: secretin N-terminal domain-containing protein [Pseudomonadota bacterium]
MRGAAASPGHRLAAGALLLLLAGCESVYEARPTPETERDGQNAVRRFFSAENLRAATFDPETGQVLRTDLPPSAGLTENFIDGPLADGQPQFRQYYERQLYGGLGRTPPPDGTLDAGAVTISVDDDLENAEPAVSLSFENDSLDFVLQQILGGVLGENYIATTGDVGPVNFTTERPIPVTQLVPVLRDILGRYGLVLRRINGIYHIAPPGTIDALVQLQASGERSDFQLAVLPLGSGEAEDVAPVVEALLPESASVVGVESANSVVVAALPQDIQAIRQLIDELFGAESGTDIVAIIPVRESAPEVVVEELRGIFDPRAAENPSLDVTMVPLPAQRAILVAAATRQQIADVRALVAEIDIDLRERPALRSIQLNYLSALEVADQIAAVLGDGQLLILPDMPTAEQTQSRILQARANRQQGGVDGVSVTAEQQQAGNLSQPALLRDGQPAGGGGGDGGGNGGDGGSGEDGGPSEPPENAVAAGPVVVPDVRNNVLLVRSTFEDFEEIERLVKSLDTPLPQLVLEATILEVALNDQLDYGVQFFLQENGITVRSTQGPAALADPALPGLAALANFGAFTGVNIDVLLTALQQVTDLRVVSSPYVSVVSGETAQLFVGDEIPFLTASQESSTDGTVTVTNEVETRDTGITVNITPVVRPDDTVRMQIFTEVSSAVQEGLIDDPTPTISRRRINSDLAVTSGQTVLLGGLIQNRLQLAEGGIPVLRQIPLFGNLFGTKASDVDRVELLILVTPRAIRTGREIERITREVRRQSVRF